MRIPDWAASKEKYYRAIGICGVKAEESDLKAAYRRMGGLVREDVPSETVSEPETAHKIVSKEPVSKESKPKKESVAKKVVKAVKKVAKKKK